MAHLHCITQQITVHRIAPPPMLEHKRRMQDFLRWRIEQELDEAKAKLDAACVALDEAETPEQEGIAMMQWRDAMHAYANAKVRYRHDAR